MSEMEELRCYIAFDERSNGKDRDDHHERGKPGALFAISKIDFHGFLAKVAPCFGSQFRDKCESSGIGIPDWTPIAFIRAG